MSEICEKVPVVGRRGCCRSDHRKTGKSLLSISLLAACLVLTAAVLGQPAGSTEPVTTFGSAQTDVGRFMETEGLFLSLITLFVLGLALNLTPCVYPMIPVTIGYFSRQGEERTTRVFMLGLMYLVGIAVTYSTLGVVAAVTGQMFGALLRNSWVLVGIAAVMAALALSLFGLYQIQAPFFIRGKISGRSTAGGLLGALSMGLFIGIVAAPCVGPVTIGLLTYVGATGNPWFGFWMFFTLSLGLGAPYLVLGMFSGGLKKLPKSGVWMLWVERFFGFALLGVALYFLAPVLPEWIVSLLVLTLAAASALYLGWLHNSNDGGRVFYWLRKATAFSIMAIGVGAIMPPASQAAVDWHSYDAGTLDRPRKEGRPVLLDFYADWCIPCRELDRFTFSDERVIEATESFLLVKVDLTEYGSPEAEQLRRNFGVTGFPELVFLDTKGNEIREARIVGFVAADNFLQLLQRLFPLQESLIENPEEGS